MAGRALDSRTVVRPEDAAAPARAGWPVWVWAAVGGAVLLLQLWIWTRFLASSPQELTRYRDPGSTTFVWAKIFEVALVVIFVATVGLTVRTAVRERRLTANAKVLIGFASMVWLDPLLNYFRPGFYFTSNFVNIESWVRFIPGQIAPHANLTPVPYLWVTTAYLGYFLPVVLLNIAVIRRVHGRWPGLRLPALMVVAYGVSLPLDIALEGFALRTGTFAYPAASHTWSLWGGETYQFPIIEMIGAPMFWVAMAAILYRTDAAGVIPWERGAEHLTGRRASAVRVLAAIGCINTLFLILPMGITQIGVMHTDPFPAGYPLDLSAGWCGDEGQPYGPCPGPGVSWKVREPGAGDDPAPDEVYRSNGFFSSGPGRN